MSNMEIQQKNRLVPIREGMPIVGVKSETSYRKLVEAGQLPPFVRRGRNVFHLESDLQAYVARLAKSREVA